MNKLQGNNKLLFTCSEIHCKFNVIMTSHINITIDSKKAIKGYFKIFESISPVLHTKAFDLDYTHSLNHLIVELLMLCI